MRRYLTIIILSISISLLNGCRANRASIVVAQADSTSMASVVDVKQVHSQLQSVDSSAESNSSSIHHVDITTTHTMWSAPDSLGRQYPLETTVTELKSRKRDTTHTSTATQGVAHMANTLTVHKADTLAQVQHRVEMESVKPIGTAWRVVVAEVLSLGVVLILILILKRFKLI